MTLELEEMKAKCKRLQMALTALVIPFQDAVKQHSPEIWKTFIMDCMSREQREAKGWLLPEEKAPKIVKADSYN